MRQAEVAALSCVRVGDVPLKLIPEMPDGRRYRPGRCIAQWANGVAFDLALNIPQQIYIAHLAFSKLDVMQNFFHPSGAFAAGRALAAAFVAVEPCER